MTIVFNQFQIIGNLADGAGGLRTGIKRNGEAEFGTILNFR